MTAADVPASFDAQYVELFVRAHRCAARILGAGDAAEDVAAETMARAFAHWSKIESYAAAWVTRVSLNAATDVVRRKRTLLPPSVASEDTTIDRLILRTHLAQLPRRQRQVVAARYILGFDEKETASLLGISIGTVHTHVKRALARLRSELADTTDDADPR